jgi:chromosome segregation ATPase
MASWVVTVPDNVPKDKQKEFFEYTYMWLNNRYGEENCIGASVHMDETTPHMHYYFLPIQRSLDKQGQEIDKLNAKAVVCRKDLQTFHQELASFLGIAMGFRPNILKDGVTKELGNQSINELKKTTYSLKHLANEVAEVEVKKSLLRRGKSTVKTEDVEKLKQADGVVRIAESMAHSYYEAKKDAEHEINKVAFLQDNIDRLEQNIVSLEVEKGTLKEQIKTLEGSNKSLRERLGTIDTLQLEKAELEAKIKRRNKKIMELEETVRGLPTHEQVKQLMEKISKLEKKNLSLLEEVKELEELCEENDLFLNSNEWSR